MQSINRNAIVKFANAEIFFDLFNETITTGTFQTTHIDKNMLSFLRIPFMLVKLCVGI